MSFDILHRYTRAVLHTAAKDTLRDADLRDANLSCADLSYADLRGANLSYADLSYADLRGANLSYADLRGADLSGANLRGANLRDADLRDADLSDANLSYANLSYANLSGADVPIVPRLHTLILAALETGGTLDMGSWHSKQCATTHCRAGWAISLAGHAGKELEGKVGPAMAGALISIASCPALDGKVPNFYDTNDGALADIRRLAALEQKAVQS